MLPKLALRRVAGLSTKSYYLPMRRVLVIAFPGAQTLDVTGPAEVFAAVGRVAEETTRAHGAGYEVTLASTEGGLITTSSGLRLDTVRLARIPPARIDTVLVSGGDERAIRGAIADVRLGRWILRAHGVTRRLGSVCSGSFVLAALGLLDGRRAATHWSACERLQHFRPAIAVDRNAIFVRDGSLWTSAGVTTGIDMALAMVEDDHDAALADRIAAQLVLYARRPGFQSQWSDVLVAQSNTSDPLGTTIAAARKRLRQLDVPKLAKLAALSQRTLHRRCLEQLQLTPAKLIERLRVEEARALLATTNRAVKSIAADCGFHGPERMRRAFERELGLGPRDVRLLHARAH